MSRSFMQSIVGRRTDWRVRSSDGGGGSVNTPIVKLSAGSATVFLWVRNGTVSPEHRLIITGLKAGYGAGITSPVNVEGAIRELPTLSIGHIHAGPTHDSKLTIPAFEGLTIIYTPSLGFSGLTFGVSLVFFGVPYHTLGALFTPMPHYVNVGLYLSNAIGLYGSPGGSITAADLTYSIFIGIATAG